MLLTSMVINHLPHRLVCKLVVVGMLPVIRVKVREFCSLKDQVRIRALRTKGIQRSKRLHFDKRHQKPSGEKMHWERAKEGVSQIQSVQGKAQ
jgi:hypothetical protein